MTFILDQLARSGLLPEATAAAILSGKNPLLSEVIPHLVIGSLDANALTAGDKTATWTQRRMSRQLLALTFLSALLLETVTEPNPHGGRGFTAAQNGHAS